MKAIALEDGFAAQVRKYDTALIEELVDGPELTVGILGSEAASTDSDSHQTRIL
ncbi:MAG: hypothetical protein R3E58_01565 [Phycisphaerae bacterium]